MSASAASHVIHLSPSGVLMDERPTRLDGRELPHDVLVRIPLGTALWEEVAFRAVLLAALPRLLPLRQAVTLSAVVFGVWHVHPTLSALAVNDLAQGPALLPLVLLACLATAVAGVLLAWLRLRSGGLLAPVLLHLSAKSLRALAAAAAGRLGRASSAARVLCEAHVGRIAQCRQRAQPAADRPAARTGTPRGDVVRLDLSERALFLRAFLTHPRRVGAVLPTSERAVADMLDMAALEQARLVVELGAGTGSHTAPVLARLGPQARLVAFEIDPALADAVRAKLSDPRLQVVTGSAETVEDVLQGQRPDVVVSALPFTSLPAGTGRLILERTARVLAPQGVLLVLQYSPFIVRELSRLFARRDRRVCLLNVPPAFLYACREPLAAGRAAS